MFNSYDDSASTCTSYCSFEAKAGSPKSFLGVHNNWKLRDECRTQKQAAHRVRSTRLYRSSIGPLKRASDAMRMILYPFLCVPQFSKPRYSPQVSQWESDEIKCYDNERAESPPLVEKSTSTLALPFPSIQSPRPEVYYNTHVMFNALLNRSYMIVVPLPCSSILSCDRLPSGSRGIDLSNFLINLPTLATPIIRRANPEALIDRMLPVSIFPTGARHIAACFWAWLCVLDGRQNLQV